MKYYLYNISDPNGDIRYFGITSDIKKREKRHNYLLKSGHDKELYNNFRKFHPNETIRLAKMMNLYQGEYHTKADAKRAEMASILQSYLFYLSNKSFDYHNEHKHEFPLWQSIPNISNRGTKINR